MLRSFDLGSNVAMKLDSPQSIHCVKSVSCDVTRPCKSNTYNNPEDIHDLVMFRGNECG